MARNAEKTVSKTIRLPESVVDFINTLPGKSFSDKLITFIEMLISSGVDHDYF